MSEVGLSDWLRVVGSQLPGNPGWDKLGPDGGPINKELQLHMSNATNEDRRRWTFFAIAAARAGYWRGNQSHKPDWAYFSTHPDDPWWQATPERKKDHDHFVQLARTFKWEQHNTGFDPGAIISDIGHAISKIPVVGDVAHIVGEAAIAPFNVAKNIASGERLDHVFVDSLKDQVKIVKDVAPYAQTVVSLVPGIGTGVAAAIGAGAALVEGKSIDEAAKAAIRGAIPGGPIAAAGFDAAMKVASGENVGKAALESARNLVPPGPAQKAFDIGLAVATGEKLQNALAKGLISIAPEGLQTVLAAGQKALSSTPGLADAIKAVAPGDAQRGFQMAAGLLSHAGINEKALTSVRSQLPAAVRQGFDAALKTQEKHLPWIGNIVTAAASTPAAAKAAIAASVAPKAAPHAPEPPRAAPHAPEPPRAAPHAPEPPKPAHAPVLAPAAATSTPKPLEPPPRTMSPANQSPPMPITSVPYPPYPPSITGVHGLGAAPSQSYPPYPSSGAVSAPPHLPHPSHAFHRSPGGERHPASGIRWAGGRAPWWGTPYIPSGVPMPAECRVWGAPIEIPPPMATAARVALSVSGGQPSMIQGPDGVVYLFAFENGAITAHPCAG